MSGPTLFLIVGLPGSGKTTLARRLEIERRALRLTPDEWIEGILADGSDRAELDRLRSPIEAVQWQVAARTLELGLDVILDWGFWSRRERDDFRARAAALGAQSELRFLDVPRDLLRERLARRNAELGPGAFTVTEQDLERFASWFEPPAEDEIA